jgi:hypothetical protein
MIPFGMLIPSLLQTKEELMKTPSTIFTGCFSRSQPSPEVNQRPVARYFDLTVEVVVRMNNCSLIRYGERHFIVSSEDLQLARKVAA